MCMGSGGCSDFGKQEHGFYNARNKGRGDIFQWQLDQALNGLNQHGTL